jgi:5-epi-alpha-selinene synthase
MKKLSIPFAFQACKLGIEAEKHINDWVRNFGIFDNMEDEQKFQSYCCSWLVTYSCPNAGKEEQFVLADWNAFLFILDDLCDTSEIGQDYTKLSHRFDYLIQLLNDRTYLSKDAQDPIAAYMCEIWSRIREYQPDIPWQKRFIVRMKEYFDSCVWEARNRQLHAIPDQENYVRNRYFSAAVYPLLELGDITDKINIPIEIKNHPILKEMTDIAALHIGLCNDLFSYSKEILQEEVHHNLVLQIAQQNQVAVGDAVTQVIDQVNGMIERFLTLKKDLPIFGSNVDQDVNTYVELLQSWIRGHVDWVEKKSQRYITPHDGD